jgi:indolepyruvate ferredoxin oxidoreductase beta subunit
MIKMTEKRLKIHICGMGGQGIGSTSRIIAGAAYLAGLTVGTIETHGLAQRGGRVVSELSIGYDPRESPICGEGEADIIIALEALEGLRSLPLLKQNGLAVVNTTTYHPLTVRVSKGSEIYPTLDQIENEIKRWTPNLVMIDARKDANLLGLSQSMNVILLGAILGNSTILPFNQEHLEQAIKLKVPSKYHEVNIKAFHKGMEYKI